MRAGARLLLAAAALPWVWYGTVLLTAAELLDLGER